MWFVIRCFHWQKVKTKMQITACTLNHWKVQVRSHSDPLTHPTFLAPCLTSSPCWRGDSQKIPGSGYWVLNTSRSSWFPQPPSFYSKSTTPLFSFFKTKAQLTPGNRSMCFPFWVYLLKAAPTGSVIQYTLPLPLRSNSQRWGRGGAPPDSN